MRWAFMRGLARQHAALTATYRACNFSDSSTIFSKQQSFIEIQAAVEEARQNRVDAEAEVAELRGQLESVRAQQVVSRQEVAETTAARKEAEGHRNAAGRRLAELGAAARSAKAEADRIGQGRFQAEQARDRDVAGLADLEDRLQAAESSPNHAVNESGSFATGWVRGTNTPRSMPPVSGQPAAPLLAKPPT
jgi:chromosome segregation ATPase